MSMMHVYQAITEVMVDLAKSGISKDRKNQQQNYAFRGIDDVYAALSPALSAHNLCILPRVVERHVEERTTQKGGAIFYTTLTVEFDLVSAVDGSKHTVCTVGEAMDTADKSSSKAMSAAYKYAAFQTFCIPTVGDNDADETTHEDIQPKPRKDEAARNAFSTALTALREAGNKGAAALRDYWTSDEFEVAYKALPADWQRTLTQEKDAFLASYNSETRLKTVSDPKASLDKQFGPD